jgi:hypothetical protein
MPASHAFLPWLRRGFATRVQTPGARTSIDVRLTFNETLSEKATLAMYGPGDVVGIEPRAVARIWPRRDIHDAESNCFPLIEFYQSDLPWRFSPVPVAGDRLMPWMCLLVLAADEFERRAQSAILVTQPQALPRSDQLWAWAHVQVSGTRSIDAAGLSSLLTTEPHRVVARIVAPRRLVPDTTYTAFLVPTFERGRQAGLGQEPTAATEPAWDGTAPVELPVYYRWSFQTAFGDFEYLAKQLEGRELPSTLGTRPIDASDPGMSLPPASPSPISLAGALRAINAPPDNWSAADRAAFVPSLTTLVNRQDDLLQSGAGTRIVSPPLYARWHAALTRLDASAPRPYCFELNADPRHRTTAGLGAQVVQREHQALLASAWQQVGEVRRLNDELRFAQLARAAAQRLYQRHVLPAKGASLVALSTPVHRLVRIGERTVRARFDESPIPQPLLEPAMRRLARPTGPLGRRQGRIERSDAVSFVERLNRHERSLAPERPVPEQLATASKLAKDSVPDWLDGQIFRSLRQLPREKLLAWAAVFLVAAFFCFATAIAIPIGIILLAGAATAFKLAVAPPGVVRRWEAQLALRDAALTSEHVRAAAVLDGFAPTEGDVNLRNAPAPQRGTGRAETEASRAFRSAATGLFDAFRRPVPTLERPRSVDFDGVVTALRRELDPAKTIAGAMKDRFQVRPGVLWEPDDPVEPIMAAPEFPQPMYEPLKRLSQEWLLPGVSTVLPNTVGVLSTNQKFVEAYMVGLNHEAARMLLFNEYPTDQRGTYFRQFWDVRGYAGLPGNEQAEALRDILRIHEWRATAPLGVNSARRAPPGGEHLVLLIRGELLKRYPTTIVQAVRAKWAAGVRELDESTVKAPVFAGTLEPDIAFFGFELTPAQARGVTDPSGDPGWFFVLAEHPTEPRFGLDAEKGPPTPGASPWTALSWPDLAVDEPSLAALRVIDLAAELPDTSGIIDPAGAKWHAQAGARAADLAYITLRLPFRIGIHADDLLPPP